MIKVAYIGPVTNLSGYSDAARNNICAISSAGVPIDVLPVSFEKFETDTGELGKIIKPLITSRSDAPIQIIHTIPPVFDKLIAFNKYNIGYTAWETDKLPTQWVDCINRLNEVWVPSQYNKECFVSSGVRVPIFVMPHTFNRAIFEKEIIHNPFNKPSGFVFYSIFQFLERKGAVPLLKAYLTEFSEQEDVCLLLKTYLFDPTDPKESEAIKKRIQELKDKLRLPSYPKIFLVTSALSRPQINGLHKSCDCLISAHSSEGFGITLAEGMIAGKPVIATDYSGSKDFLFPEHGYPVSYQLTPVFNMPWQAYDGHQVWADINVMDLRRQMRYVFENRQEAKIKGMKAQRFVDENLSWEKIGNQMRGRLEEIHAGL